MSKELDIIDDLIENDNDVHDVIDELEYERVSDRELKKVAKSAIQLAEDLEDMFDKSVGFDEIIEVCYMALLAELADNYKIKIPRSLAKAYQEVESATKEASRSSRSGRDRDRGTRSERSSRSGRSGRSSRRDDDRDRSRSSRRDRNDERSNGFGKGKNNTKRNRREEAAEEVVVVDDNKLINGKTVLYDVTVSKYVKGSLVESYDEHELSPIAKQYERSKVEEDRRVFVEGIRDNKFKVESYTSANDFINLSPDDNMSFGIIRKDFKFNTSEIDGFDIIIGGVLSTDPIATAFGIYRSLNESINIPQSYRIRQHIDTVVRDILDLVFNVYSKVPGAIENDIISEWDDIRALFDNSEVFNHMVTDEVVAVVKGLTSNLLSVTYDEDAGNITFTSTYFAGKVRGDFTNYTSIVGDGRVGEVIQEHHPVLFTASTATLEARDSTLGDAWSKVGCIPVIVADSTGESIMILSTKSSDAKWVPNEFISLMKIK